MKFWDIFYQLSENPKIAGIAFNGAVSVWGYCLNELSALILLKSMHSLHGRKLPYVEFFKKKKIIFFYLQIRKYGIKFKNVLTTLIESRNPCLELFFSLKESPVLQCSNNNKKRVSLSEIHG